MDNFSVWKHFFQNWPEGVPTRGVLVTSYDEQIPFDGYLASDSMLLVERVAPDTSGARKVLIPFGNVVAVKITDVLKSRPFAESGFLGRLPKK